MSDMIERVARAIRARKFERNGRSAVLDSELPLTDNELDDARAAIEALLVPTIDMIRAGAPLIDLPNDWLQSGLLTGKQRTALAVFTAMLDDALQRHERGNADSK